MDDDLKRKALRAARAATMSAALVGTTACSEPDPSASSSDTKGWTQPESRDAAPERPDTAPPEDTADTEDVVADTASLEDVAADVAADTNDGPDTTPDTVADVAPDTNERSDTTPDTLDDVETGDARADAFDTGSDTTITECRTVSDGVCPASCERTNDADCCEQEQFCRWNGQRCGCAVPGPFVPPSMVA